MAKDIWVKIGVIATIISILLGAIYFLYDRFYIVPNVTYSILPSYRLPAPLNDRQLVIIVINNVGGRKATGLRASIKTSGPVQALQVESPEQTSYDEWQNKTSLVILAPRLANGAQILLTMLVSTKESPITSIEIVHDDGVGTESMIGAARALGGEVVNVSSVFFFLPIFVALITFSTFVYTTLKTQKDRKKKMIDLREGFACARLSRIR
jgi:hypothetical protein